MDGGQRATRAHEPLGGGLLQRLGRADCATHTDGGSALRLCLQLELPPSSSNANNNSAIARTHLLSCRSSWQSRTPLRLPNEPRGGRD